MSIEQPEKLTKLTQEEIERDKMVVEDALLEGLMSTIQRKSDEQGSREVVKDKIGLTGIH